MTSSKRSGVGVLTQFEVDLFMGVFNRAAHMAVGISGYSHNPFFVTILELARGQTFTPIENPSFIEKDPITVLYYLHMYGVDKALQYPMTVEKFIEKNP